MNFFETAQVTQANRTTCEDRAKAFHFDERVVMAVADGAGGTGSGGAAAEIVVSEIGTRVSDCHEEADWLRLLRDLDQRVAPGETTAVVIDVTRDRICGASVGDSRAWLVDDGQEIDLTAHQVRKPLLGSGEAEPVGFHVDSWQGLILVGTDGLFNYVKREVLLRHVARMDFYALPRVLLESVRLLSGEYWDDVAIVACRRRPLQRGRRVYEIAG